MSDAEFNDTPDADEGGGFSWDRALSAIPADWEFDGGATVARWDDLTEAQREDAFLSLEETILELRIPVNKLKATPGDLEELARRMIEDRAFNNPLMAFAYPEHDDAAEFGRATARRAADDDMPSMEALWRMLVQWTGVHLRRAESYSVRDFAERVGVPLVAVTQLPTPVMHVLMTTLFVMGWRAGQSGRWSEPGDFAAEMDRFDHDAQAGPDRDWYIDTLVEIIDQRKASGQE